MDAWFQNYVAFLLLFFLHTLLKKWSNEMKQFNSWRFYWQDTDTSRLETIGKVMLSFLLHSARPFNEANDGFYTFTQSQQPYKLYWVGGGGYKLIVPVVACGL